MIAVKGYAFAGRSPLEIGDSVVARLSPLCAPSVYTVEDILTMHSARTGDVVFAYQLSHVGRPVPIGYIEARLVDGRPVQIGEEAMTSMEVTSPQAR